MKRFLLICLFLPLFAYSEAIDVELQCFQTMEIFKTLKDKFYEMPIIIGNVEDEAQSTMTLWLNAELKSWTIVATIEDKTCVVGYGKNFKVLNLTR